MFGSVIGYDTKQKAPFITKRGRFELIRKDSHKRGRFEPVNNQPTHPYQNRQIYTKDFVRLNSIGNISTNQNQAPENSENNDNSLLIQSHAKITALVFDRENPKS